MSIAKAGELSGIVVWFDTEMVEGITLSTSPYHPETYWQQTIFRFNNSLTV
jgi:hypothetical protein